MRILDKKKSKVKMKDQIDFGTKIEGGTFPLSYQIEVSLAVAMSL